MIGYSEGRRTYWLVVLKEGAAPRCIVGRKSPGDTVSIRKEAGSAGRGASEEFVSFLWRRSGSTWAARAPAPPCIRCGRGRFLLWVRESLRGGRAVGSLLPEAVWSRGYGGAEQPRPACRKGGLYLLTRVYGLLSQGAQAAVRGSLFSFVHTTTLLGRRGGDGAGGEVDRTFVRPEIQSVQNCPNSLFLALGYLL